MTAIKTSGHFGPVCRVWGNPNKQKRSGSVWNVFGDRATVALLADLGKAIFVTL